MAEGMVMEIQQDFLLFFLLDNTAEFSPPYFKQSHSENLLNLSLKCYQKPLNNQRK
jgi:hypothetical protein